LSSPDQLVLDGVALLLPDGARLAALPPNERQGAMEALLSDSARVRSPKEFLEGVRRRRALMLSETLSLADVRAQLLFLHGPPSKRQHIDCDIEFRPLEVWSYGDTALVLYQPTPGSAYKLWLPGQGKRVLYTHEMEGILEDSQGSRERLDRKLCKTSVVVDAATGVEGLAGFVGPGPDPHRLAAMLAPPEDLNEWAREAGSEPTKPAKWLALDPWKASFPQQQGQRIEARLRLVLPPAAPIDPFITVDPQGGQRRELRIGVDVVVEHAGEFFEQLEMRFTSPVTADQAAPTVLAVPVLLRPGSYVVRLRVRDEVGGALDVISGTLDVPRTPQPPPADDVTAIGPNGATGERLDRTLANGAPGLLLVVPPQDILFDSVRAQAMVQGDRIVKVSFLLDGAVQLSRMTPPWSVEIKLARLPREQLLRAEGYDSSGALVSSDEVVLNQLHGQLAVKILAPPARTAVVGETLARVQVIVPEERHVESVELSVNEEVQAKLTHPPWQAKIKVPSGPLTYLTVNATLDDGSRAEAVRMLNAPESMEEVDVALVQLYTTVTDSSGSIVRGLSATDFEVRENGKPQRLVKAELAEDLPLVVGVALDVSGSMHQALGEAQRAAGEFLHNLVKPRDRCFAVAFSVRPTLIAPRTADLEATARALAGLRAEGSTSLYDAVVLSLYYFRGGEGRRALVVLSDGADTDSLLSFDEMIDYARDSGVVIYTVGLDTQDLDVISKHRLAKLAEVSGGRAFVVKSADELADVYGKIETELRSQYVLAYATPNPGKGGFRKVEVKVKRGGANARTRPGYVP
jgi:Ca-activated chloride channel family protein